MKAVLFCQNPYAFGILNPIKEELLSQGDDYLWYVPDNLLNSFPFKSEKKYTSSIKDIIDYKPDANFVPGNEIPHYIRGVKTQIFHGFAGEKKGHFRIRDYFDLYLTQGPYFTEKFKDFREYHKNFEVVETGWPKLDIVNKEQDLSQKEKENLLSEVGAKKVILYAPTFSPSLTSAPFLKDEIKKLAQNPDYLIIFKFHDLMSKKLILDYREIAESFLNIHFESSVNILKYLIMSDLLISDTSSVIYEALILNKPVVSFKNISNRVCWDDSLIYENLSSRVRDNLIKDDFKGERLKVKSQFHPYSDGQSSLRVVKAVKDYINEFGVPETRKLSFLRRYKMNKMFGKK